MSRYELMHLRMQRSNEKEVDPFKALYAKELKHRLERDSLLDEKKRISDLAQAGELMPLS